MRWIAKILICSVSGLAAAPAIAKGNVYMSLMGEIFRTSDAGEDAFDQWFKLADGDGDGGISRLEFRADAQSFFQTLDTSGDKVIDGDEMKVYEEEAPSRSRVAGGGGPDRSSARPTPKSSSAVDKGQVALVTSGDAPSATRIHPGDNRINFAEVPQPVAMADLNIDRRVTIDEFMKTASKRFANYDVDQDAKLSPKELR